MRKTTNYRRFERGGAVVADTPPAPPVAIVDVNRNDVASDDASAAFQKQIDALKESERIQRERAMQAAPALSLREKQFLKLHPDFEHINNREHAMAALMRAHQENHMYDSPEFHEAVGQHFKALRVPPPTVEDIATANPSSPEFLEHLDLPEPRRSNSIVSAPVSREVPSSHYPERPGRITLTPEMKDMARRLNQSEAEYARGLIEMRERDKEYGR